MQRTAVVSLTGHLEEGALRAALASATAELRGQFAVLVDCSTMTGYDLAARHAFVDWNREHKGRVTAVAVVTEKAMWHLVVSAMAMASGQEMRAFARRADAEVWLSERS